MLRKNEAVRASTPVRTSVRSIFLFFPEKKKTSPQKKKAHVMASLRKKNDSWQSALREKSMKAAEISGVDITCAKQTC